MPATVVQDKEEAESQATAINARKEKAKKEGYYYVPWGVTSFSDLDESHKARAMTDTMDRLIYQYQDIIANIWGSDDVEDKQGAMTSLTTEFNQRLDKVMSGEEKGISGSIPKRIISTIKEAISRPREDTDDETEEKEAPVKGLMVWKGDDGRYYWLARYSNSFRDSDSPPEIISADSHKRFVKMVDEGDYPYPELWLWHQKQWKWGEATTVSVDEVQPGLVFALAGGIVDKDKGWIAKRYATGEVHSLVSHGMPGQEIVRDPSDSSIYLQHQTVEISPLPPNRAANKHTGFQVFTKENDMALSDGKRQEMAETLGATADDLRQVEQSNSDTGKAAVDQGVEFKEKSGEAEPKQAEEKEKAPETQYVAVKEFENFADEMVRGFQDVMGVVTEQLKELKEQVSELKEAREVEKKSLTPAASVYAALTGSIGKEAKAPDEVKQLAPKETPATTFSGKNPGIGFIDQMHAMNNQEAPR